jgi:integrase
MVDQQRSFVMESGERYCLLLDQSGLPLYFPNLYVTTQVRNRSLSFSAMESTLNGISVLNRYLEERDENLEVRFYEGRFLDDSELDAIRDYCQIKFRSRTTKEEPNLIIPLNGLQRSDDKVSSETEYVRLTVIAKYLKWLAEQLTAASKDRLSVLQIGRMEKALKSRRPVKRSRNAEINVKGLSGDQLDLLFELFRPESNFNPFKDSLIRVRNRLIFLMLYHLGLRGGELLNIRIRDIDFSTNQLIVARRADEKDDPRRDQPLVKTLDRRLPIKDTLVKELHDYIIGIRRLIANSTKNDFLFITHKSGPTQGQPLSKSAYKKIIDVVSKVSPILFSLTGHKLRHAWNEAFSDQMDSMDEPPSEEQQEKIRSYLMGWREGSGTAATYNKRFIRKKSNEAAMRLQEGMIRLPKRKNNG